MAQLVGAALGSLLWIAAWAWLLRKLGGGMVPAHIAGYFGTLSFCALSALWSSAGEALAMAAMYGFFGVPAMLILIRRAARREASVKQEGVAAQ